VTVGRSLLWFLIGVAWVRAALAIVYAALKSRSKRLDNNES
jgi:hypothetical protein